MRVVEPPAFAVPARCQCPCLASGQLGHPPARRPLPAPVSASLTLVTSDRPATLVDRLAIDFARAPLSPFDEDTVVVPTRGTARWIRHELARRLGCAAGLRIPFPAVFARELAAAVDRRELDPRYECDALTWRILQLFEEGLAEEPEFAALHAFASGAETRKRLGLAARLATCFDDYLLYRPDAILAWESGDVGPIDEPDAHWQAALWRRLTAEDPEPHHLARWFDGALGRLERGDVDAALLPRRVSIFGVTALPPVLAQLFRALARHVPVRAYLLAPPRAEWASETPMNALSAAFGHASRETLSLLAAGATLEEHHELRDAACPECSEGTLLGR